MKIEKNQFLILLVISHEPVELQKRALPFLKGFFTINDFVNHQKALKPFFDREKFERS